MHGVVVLPLWSEIVAFWGIRHPFSALSHLAGAGLAMVALAMLVHRARQQGYEGRRLAMIWVYGLAMVGVFAASFAFHYVLGSMATLNRLNHLDHATILLFIPATAGVLYDCIPHGWGRWLIRAIWGVGGGAVVLQYLWWPLSPTMTAVLYGAVGWSALSGTLGLIRTFGFWKMRLLFAGGLVLTVAALCFALRAPVLWVGLVEAHEVFHLLALLGIGLHFGFIYRHVLPHRVPTHRITLPRPQADSALHRQAA